MSIYDVTEADEAVSKDQALRNLRSIYIDNGPGNLTDLYSRAAWTRGASVQETNSLLRQAHRLHHTKVLADLYNVVLAHGRDPRTQYAQTIARSVSIPEIEIVATIEAALEAREIATRVSATLGVIAYERLALQ